MIKSIFILLFFAFMQNINSQDWDCETYKKNVAKYANLFIEIDKEKLDSSYLDKVSLYYMQVIFAIVEIGDQKYIYCEIPEDSIGKFIKDPGTYGEKFNKHIAPFTCDCE